MVYEPVTSGDTIMRAPLNEYCDVYARLVDQRVNGTASGPTQLELTRLAKLYPDDPLIRLHLDRLDRGELGDEIVMAEK